MKLESIKTGGLPPTVIPIFFFLAWFAASSLVAEQVHGSSLDSDEGNSGTSFQEKAITASQYCLFLNEEAITDDGNIPLYDEKMGSDPLFACIVRQGSPGDYSYYVIPGREKMAATYLSQFAMVAYCDSTSEKYKTDLSHLSSDIYFRSNKIDYEVMIPINKDRFVSPLEAAITLKDAEIVGGAIVGVFILYGCYRSINYSYRDPVETPAIEINNMPARKGSNDSLTTIDMDTPTKDQMESKGPHKNSEDKEYYPKGELLRGFKENLIRSFHNTSLVKAVYSSSNQSDSGSDDFLRAYPFTDTTFSLPESLDDEEVSSKQKNNNYLKKGPNSRVPVQRIRRINRNLKLKNIISPLAKKIETDREVGSLVTREDMEAARPLTRKDMEAARPLKKEDLQPPCHEEKTPSKVIQFSNHEFFGKVPVLSERRITVKSDSEESRLPASKDDDISNKLIKEPTELVKQRERESINKSPLIRASQSEAVLVDKNDGLSRRKPLLRRKEDVLVSTIGPKVEKPTFKDDKDSFFIESSCKPPPGASTRILSGIGVLLDTKERNQGFQLLRVQNKASSFVESSSTSAPRMVSHSCPVSYSYKEVSSDIKSDFTTNESPDVCDRSSIGSVDGYRSEESSFCSGTTWAKLSRLKRPSQESEENQLMFSFLDQADEFNHGVVPQRVLSLSHLPVFETNFHKDTFGKIDEYHAVKGAIESIAKQYVSEAPPVGQETTFERCWTYDQYNKVLECAPFDKRGKAIDYFFSLIQEKQDELPGAMKVLQAIQKSGQKYKEDPLGLDHPIFSEIK